MASNERIEAAAHEEAGRRWPELSAEHAEFKPAATWDAGARIGFQQGAAWQAARRADLEAENARLRDRTDAATLRSLALALELADLRAGLEALATRWMRSETRTADYQDALADAAEDLRALLATAPSEPGPS